MITPPWKSYQREEHKKEIKKEDSSFKQDESESSIEMQRRLIQTLYDVLVDSGIPEPRDYLRGDNGIKVKKTEFINGDYNIEYFLSNDFNNPEITFKKDHKVLTAKFINVNDPKKFNLKLIETPVEL